MLAFKYPKKWPREGVNNWPDFYVTSSDVIIDVKSVRDLNKFIDIEAEEIKGNKKHFIYVEKYLKAVTDFTLIITLEDRKGNYSP